MKIIFINKLYKVSNVICILLFLSSCQAPSLINNTPELIDITHESAEQLINNDPWDYFTDFGSPYACQASVDLPIQTEPNWAPAETVWQRIRIGSQLNWSINQPRLDAEFNWYEQHPDYMLRVSQRSQRYLHYVTDQLEKKGLPLELALLPIVESAYDPFAYSHGSASGMWQFIKSTGRMYKLKQNWWYDGRRDIVASTDAAIQYLSMLNDYYKGDWLLALAAYNSGQGNVNKALRKNKKLGKALDFWSLDLPNETRSYVPKLLALAKLVANPIRYGIKLHPVPNTPYFSQIHTQTQIDLAQAATMADIAINELYLLNPGFNRWATDPDGPHRLLIPTSQEQHFKEQLKTLPPEKRIHWQRYTIKNGDSILLLAKRFNTSAAIIRQANTISGNMIRSGQTLMIPTASKHGKHYALSAKQRLNTLQKNRKGAPKSRQVFHTVESGDSLWSLSRHYKVSIAKLAHWNGIAPKDLLKQGQKLSVWVNQASTATQTKRSNVLRKIHYKVRSGDSLARIADRFNVRINDVIKWNRVNPKKYLQPGQRLTLHVDVMNTVK